MKNIKILHISNDEKFIDGAIDLFESVYPGFCGYLVNGKSPLDLRFVKSRPPRLYVHPYLTTQYFQAIEDFNPHLLFLHGLSDKHRELLDILGHRFPVFWSSWGRDIYESARLCHLMYKRETLRLIGKSYWDIKSLRKKVGELAGIFRNTYRIRSSETYLKYCTFMSTVVREDFEQFSGAYPNESKHVMYVPFNYSVFLGEENMRINSDGKTNLLIGNSANPDNNHLECLKIVKDLDLRARKVYLPLSYGGNSRYIKEILALGKFYLGDRFHPLVDFMPFKDYDVILNSVGFAIMNHSHQHAMGNILSLLNKGAKIYMDPINTAYQSLRKNGFCLSEVEEVERGKELRVLSFDEININRRLIERHYSREALLHRTNELVNTLRKQLH